MANNQCFASDDIQAIYHFGIDFNFVMIYALLYFYPESLSSCCTMIGFDMYPKPITEARFQAVAGLPKCV